MSSPKTPFVIGHRAGNDVRMLRRARELGLPLIEADVHLFRGRLEVRHLKTLGPVPVLWDRWRLAPPWTPRLLLGDLLAASDAADELMLDLKGRDRRLARRLAHALDAAGPRRLTVCSRNWSLLEPLRGVPALRLVHSVGSRRQLRALRRRYDGERLAGISVHRRLLDRAEVEDLRRRAAVVMAWPVETPEVARRLAGWGVHGLISQDFEGVTAALA